MTDVWKCYLSIIILHLARDDFVAANQQFMEFTATDEFPKSDEFAVAQQLLDAFEENNVDSLENAKKNYCLTHLNLAISRLSKELKVTGGQSVAKNLEQELEPEDIAEGLG